MFRYFDYESAPFETALPSPDCTLIAPLLTAYFDCQAPGAEAVRVQQHLADCARCAQMWRDWGDARALLHSMATPAPPHTLASEIVQASRLCALLPVAPLTAELTRASAEVPLPPQLHRSIVAATIGSTQSTANYGPGEAHASLSSPRFARSLRASKAWAPIAAVPALALWLIVATANHLTIVSPPTSPSDATMAPAFSKPALNQAQRLRRAQPLRAPSSKESRITMVPRLNAPVTKESVPAESVSAPMTKDLATSTRQIAAQTTTIAKVSWSQHPISAPLTAPATSTSAPAMVIRLRSAQPLSAPDVSASPSRSAQNSIQNSIASAPQTARPATRVAVAARSVRTSTPRRSAKLSTVAMETPALSSAPSSLTPASDLPRMAMATGTALQKATLPAALSRDNGDESLWQSDVAPGRSALAVVQALNDNRPGELRDAFDAYAQTLIDNGDDPASTL